MGSFQMEKAAVPRQLRGQRKEGLDHGICAGPTVLGSSHRALGEQRAQQEGQNQARSRSSCSIALLEKALGWFKVLKGLEGRERATPNTAPVSQPPLSVSQKELDGLPAGHPAVSSPSLNPVPEVPRPGQQPCVRPEQQALSQRLWEEPKRRMKPDVPTPEVLSVCSFSTQGWSLTCGWRHLQEFPDPWLCQLPPAAVWIWGMAKPEGDCGLRSEHRISSGAVG
ncbi:hypothetical protein DV515_00018061, partial [Chloebia gouldiae]